jgi:hypothetical protein
MAYTSSFPRMFLEPNDPFIGRVATKTIIGPYAPAAPLISKTSRLASLGSCFAEEIANVLKQRKLDIEYLFLDEHWNSAFALRNFLGWLINNEKIPAHYNEALEIENAQIPHLKAHLAATDVFIVTFGLSLCTFDEKGDLTLASKAAPGQGPLNMRQTTVEENETAILKCIDLLKKLCPHATIVMTLSPVPMLGTRTNKASVPANTISKSVLRIALNNVMERSLPDVYYWPSYEIVNWYGNHVERSFGDEDRDARHVRKKVVDIVADLFLENYVHDGSV